MLTLRISVDLGCESLPDYDELQAELCASFKPPGGCPILSLRPTGRVMKGISPPTAADVCAGSGVGVDEEWTALTFNWVVEELNDLMSMFLQPAGPIYTSSPIGEHIVPSYMCRVVYNPYLPDDEELTDLLSDYTVPPLSPPPPPPPPPPPSAPAVHPPPVSPPPTWMTTDGYAELTLTLEVAVADISDAQVDVMLDQIAAAAAETAEPAAGLKLRRVTVRQSDLVTTRRLGVRTPSRRELLQTYTEVVAQAEPATLPTSEPSADEANVEAAIAEMLARHAHCASHHTRGISSSAARIRSSSMRIDH